MPGIYIAQYLSLGIILTVKQSGVSVVAEAAADIPIQRTNKGIRRRADSGVI
jgi:hypothetical protein